MYAALAIVVFGRTGRQLKSHADPLGDNAATPRECPSVNGVFTSAKPAIVVNAASSRSVPTQTGSPGSEPTGHSTRGDRQSRPAHPARSSGTRPPDADRRCDLDSVGTRPAVVRQNSVEG